MSCCKALQDAVPLEDFLPYILPQAPNAPPEMAAHYVRMAAIEFSRHTEAVTDEHCIDVQEGVADYCIDWPHCDLVPFAVKKVCYKRELKALRDRPCAGQCLPSYTYFFDAPNDLLISPVPSCDEEKALCVELALHPSQDTCSLPRALYDQYAETLGDGAASKLLLVKGADWYDPQSAGIYLRRFKNAVSSARTLITRRGALGPVKMRARAWI